MKLTKIAIVIPSLQAGGMEKVASQLANTLVNKNELQVFVIALSNINQFYDLDEQVNYYECKYDAGKSSAIKFFNYINELRRAFCKIKPNMVLSFGDRYNGFSAIASLGLSHQVYISNRQNPLLSNGLVLDVVNRIFYPTAHGIVAQTNMAKNVILQKRMNNKVTVIPNPVELDLNYRAERERVILNVGRFGDAKNQFELVEIFTNLSNHGDWEVHFYGDGAKIDKTKQAAYKSVVANKFSFFPFTREIRNVYRNAAIFAFVSRSEGFPNALAEAMACGCACISYDCVAGPSDIIDDGVNGFLVAEGDHETYEKRLLQLMLDNDLRIRFGKAAQEKMKQFENEAITQRYLDFILS